MTKEAVNIDQLRAWADHPAANHMVPIHPDTLRAVADEIERLRAALWHIAQDEFSEAYEHCEDGQNDYWRVVNIARECSSGETGPNS